jgi:hypothetical protein
VAALGALGRTEEAAPFLRMMLDVDPNFHVSDRVAHYPYRDTSRLDLLRGHLLAAGLPP